MSEPPFFEEIVDGAEWLGAISGLVVTEDAKSGDVLLVIEGEDNAAIATITDLALIDALGEAALQAEDRMRRGTGQ